MPQTPPTLASSTPANGGSVTPDGLLTLTFSEAVKAGGGDITLTDMSNSTGDVTLDVTDPSEVFFNGSTATILPPANLDPGDSYQVSIGGAAVTDLAGDDYAGGSNLINFTVATPTLIPTGSSSAKFGPTAAGDYLLAAGTSFTETGNNPAVSAKFVGPGLVDIDIEGTLTGKTAQNAVTTAVTNGQVTVGVNGQILIEDGKGVNLNEPATGLGADVVRNLGIIHSTTSLTTPLVVAPSSNQPSGDGIDFSAGISTTSGATDHTSGGVILNGSAAHTTALIQSDSADAIGLGSNQTVVNFGQIIGDGVVNDADSNNNLDGGSTTNRYASSHGIEINGGSHDSIINYGDIEGSQHGVDAGDDSDTDIIVVNEASATITGHNGSGVGSDATSDSITNVQVTNSGTITGGSDPMYDRSGAVSHDGDGDGVDVDGGATIINNAGAVIQGTGATGFDSNGRANHSEGISIGGGSIENHGTIQGADYGVTVNNDLQVDRSGDADTNIVNESDGTITGENGYAIRLENKGSDSIDTDTITNHGTIIGGGAVPDDTGTATIEGGGVDQNTVGTLNGVTYTAGEAGDDRFVAGDGSAIQMGEGDDILVNDGSITGTNGHAISMEGGNDTVTLYAEGTVSGAIDGGAGTDVLNLTAHITTHAQTLTNVVNFEALDVQAGVWTLTGAESFSNGVTIEAGASLQIGQGATAGDLTGDISFASAAGAKTLLIAASSLTAGDFANEIGGFASGDTIDVGGIGAHAHATLGAGNVLTIVGDGATATLHLDPAQNFSGEIFTATSDGQGGADIALAAAPPSSGGGGTTTPPPANDTGTAGADTLSAAAGGDTVAGGGGDDQITGGTGHDVLYGNAGNDTISLGASSDASTVYGGMGNDVVDLTGSTHANFVSGDLGDDLLKGGAGADTLYGGDGADTIVAGSGEGQLYGNAGNDHITFTASSGSSTVFAGQGDDTVDASQSTHANFISADLGNDFIHAGAGADTVYAGDGADSILAGSGHDQLYGNAGSDYINIGATNQGSTVYGGQGGDVIDASTSTHGNFISGDAGTDIILTGTGADTIHGGEGSDTITAASGSTAQIHVGLADSSAMAGAGQGELDHILGFGSGDKLVFDGDGAATTANTTFHGGDASIANFAAAYAYAYGSGSTAGAITGSTEYAIVSDSAGHVYVFAADHAAVELDGLSGGVNGVNVGQILAA